MVSRLIALIGVFGICALTIFDALKVLTPLGFMGDLGEFSNLILSFNKLTNIRPVYDIKVYKPEKTIKKNKKASYFYKFEGARGYCVAGGEFASCDQQDVTSYDQQEPKKLTVWRKRNFVNVRYSEGEILYRRGQECPSGTKRCNADYCVKEFRDCPVTRVQILKDEKLIEALENRTDVEVNDLDKKHKFVIYRENYGEDSQGGVVNGLWGALNAFPCYQLNKNGPLRSEERMEVDLHDHQNACDLESEQNLENYHFVDKRKLLHVWNENLEDGYVDNLPNAERVKYESERVHLYARYFQQMSNEADCVGHNTAFIKDYKKTAQSDLTVIRQMLYIRIAVVTALSFMALFSSSPVLTILSGLTSLLYYMLYLQQIEDFSTFMTRFLTLFDQKQCFVKDSTFVKTLSNLATNLGPELDNSQDLCNKFMIFSASVMGLGLLLFLFGGIGAKDDKMAAMGVEELQRKAEKMVKKKKVKRD